MSAMAPEASQVLEERIRTAITAAGGTISFAQYMAMALYEPKVGYYEQTPRVVGRGGDFAEVEGGCGAVPRNGGGEGGDYRARLF